MPISQSFSRRYWPILPVMPRRPGVRLLDSLQPAGERVLIDFRAGTVRSEHGPLPIELLQEVGFQVGTPGHLEDLEQREQADVMFQRIGAVEEKADTVEEVLEAQHRPDALDQRIFVRDHASAGFSLEVRQILPDSTGLDNTRSRSLRVKFGSLPKLGATSDWNATEARTAHRVRAFRCYRRRASATYWRCSRST